MNPISTVGDLITGWIEIWHGVSPEQAILLSLCFEARNLKGQSVTVNTMALPE